jgi:hypothetical protein
MADKLPLARIMNQSYEICICLYCGAFLGYPGWNSECYEHHTRGATFVVKPQTMKRWNVEKQCYDLIGFDGKLWGWTKD